MEHRLSLFNKYTRPSIEAQTCQDFEWLLLGDPVIDLPEGNIKFIPRKNHMEYVIEATKGEDLILQTRLDNDDIFMPEYIEAIQAVAVEPEILYEFLGYRLNLRDGLFYKDIWHNAKRTSPFITLVQTPDKLKSVYCQNHGHMWSYFTLHQIMTRQWVQVIHDTNWLLNHHTDVGVGRKGKKTTMPRFVMELVEDAGEYVTPALQTNVEGEDRIK